MAPSRYYGGSFIDVGMYGDKAEWAAGGSGKMIIRAPYPVLKISGWERGGLPIPLYKTY
jgi:hypothetical protein